MQAVMDAELLSTYLYDGGAGAEARVDVELTNHFHGIGGTIITQESAKIANRINHNPSERNIHDTYLKHLILSNLDNYFIITKKYDYSHIPLPFGSATRMIEGKSYSSYTYEWIQGTEGFPWRIVVYNGETENVWLDEWIEFSNAFSQTGFSVTADVADPENSDISKNVIHETSGRQFIKNRLSRDWKRIDFGDISLPVDYKCFKDFIFSNQDSLTDVLGVERHQMISLCALYLNSGKQSIPEFYIGTLEGLIKDYRLNILKNYTARAQTHNFTKIKDISKETLR